MKTLPVPLLAAALAFALGCDDEDAFDLNDDAPWEVGVDPDDFLAQVHNPLLPFQVGNVWVYESDDEEEPEVITVEVLAKTRIVWGVRATVVRDTVTVDGELVEDTFDWYAEDRDGNVWYLGEDSCEYEDDECVDTSGSWEAGVDGALPGIAMLANPEIGDQYYQEYWEGEAEDFGEVVETSLSIGVPVGAFSGCIRTRDTTALEPDVEEFKTYCAGVGLVLEVEGDTRVELVEFSGT